VAPRDQSLNSFQRPPLVLVTEGLRATLQISQDFLSLRLRQVSLTSFRLDPLQALKAAPSLFYSPLTLADGATADAQAAGGLGLGDPTFTENAAALRQSFFNLLRS
jgi:hypothetical protein